MQTDPLGPLAGVKVLDASRVLAGPYCGQVLGDLGADVIKVEHPKGGDETRTWGPPFVGEHSAYFLSCNRNKRGIALDLVRAEDRELLFQLVRQSDVLLENFLPASAARLALTPGLLHEANPRLIIASISGFGHTGPMKDLPGYDFAIQAMSGLMSITGPAAGPPCKVGVAMTDILAGLYAAIGVLACLHARKQSGHGYHLDLALLDCALAAQVNVVQAYLACGQPPARQGNAHLQIVPYQLFATADGHLVLAVGNDEQWRRFCLAAGKQEFLEDPRFQTNAFRVQHRSILVPLLETLLAARTTAAWQALLEQADVPHSPVLSYPEVFSLPQAAARGFRVAIRDPQGRPVDFVNTPFRIAGATLPEPRFPPALGQHTEAIRKEVLGND